MEKIQVFISVATSIVTFVTLIYNIGIKQGKSRERRYYEKILQPYIEEWSQNKEIDTILVVENLIKGDDDIPKYISYLINNKKDKKSNEKLKKVLVYDYFCLYPNDVTSINGILDSILKICYYVLFATALISLFTGALCLESFFNSIILVGYNFITKKGEMLGSNSIDPKACIYLLSTGIILIFVCMGVMKLANWINMDRYSLNKKKINSMIKRKCKRYDKNREKYFY